MRSRQIVMAISSAALASMTGCAAHVYDNGYAYDNRPGYDNGPGYDDQYAYNDTSYNDQYGYNDQYNDQYGYDSYSAAPPELVVLPGTDIYAAPTISAGLYFVDGYWWRPMHGHWYRSRYYDRDWGMVSATPYFYRSIPSGWRDDYYHNRWRGRPYDYYHVSRADVTNNWDKWKRERYWRDDRWASSRTQYRRERVSSDSQRYDDRRSNDGRYERRDTATPVTRERYDRRGTYTSNDRDRNTADRERNDRYTNDRERNTRYTNEREQNTRYESNRRGEYPRETSEPVYGREERTEQRTVTPASRDTRERREVRPATRTRTETRTVTPAGRSTRSAPSSVRHTEQPVRRSTTVRTEHRTTTTPARQSDRNRRPATQQEQRQDERKNNE